MRLFSGSVAVRTLLSFYFPREGFGKIVLGPQSENVEGDPKNFLFLLLFLRRGGPEQPKIFLGK